MEAKLKVKDWNAPGGLRGNWVQVIDLHGYISTNTSSSVKKEKTEQSDCLMEVLTFM